MSSSSIPRAVNDVTHAQQRRVTLEQVRCFLLGVDVTATGQDQLRLTVQVGDGDVSTGLDQLSHGANVATLAGETQARYIVSLIAKPGSFDTLNLNFIIYPLCDRRVRDVNVRLIFVIQRLN